MADSLFDNRYRYDYIYPRGRSGETLRAVDTQDNDRPVVIKRPAPNDAPPIRAGQEVSILNERKALTRLAGHPVLTALLGGGQFSSGGTAHQYIVMERGQGTIVADMVLRTGAARENACPNWKCWSSSTAARFAAHGPRPRYRLQRRGRQAPVLGSRQLPAQSHRLGQRGLSGRRRNHAAGHQPPERYFPGGRTAVFHRDRRRAHRRSARCGRGFSARLWPRY